MPTFQRFLIAAALMITAPSIAFSQAPPAAPTPSPSELSLADGIRRAMLDSLPREFNGENDWGEKKQISRGLKISREEGRPQLERRKKEVNHGLWTQYKINLIDPEQNLQVRVEKLRRTAPGQLAFELYLSARIDGEARVERWRRGVKFMNFKAEAASVVEARVECEVALRPIAGGGLGTLMVEPRVNAAHLSLVDVDLRRVSKFDGPAANEFGDRMRRTLDKELHSREGEIVRKLNQAIAANADKLQFTSDSFVSAGWTKAGEFLTKLGKPAAAAATEASQAPAPPATTPISDTGVATP
ncbi:MAG TPA: hypothetical protein VGJ26_10210 [Pirellulales bacterium]|jgi:hypothetical protein